MYFPLTLLLGVGVGNNTQTLDEADVDACVNYLGLTLSFVFTDSFKAKIRKMESYLHTQVLADW